MCVLHTQRISNGISGNVTPVSASRQPHVTVTCDIGTNTTRRMGTREVSTSELKKLLEQNKTKLTG